MKKCQFGVKNLYMVSVSNHVIVTEKFNEYNFFNFLHFRLVFQNSAITYISLYRHQIVSIDRYNFPFDINRRIIIESISSHLNKQKL